MGRKNQHRFHGAKGRFEEIAEFIADHYENSIRFIGDVAGGQGMLSRLLNKKFNYQSEVIDPRGRAMVGVPVRAEEFQPAMAHYYDLLIGLHPDEATRPLAEAALVRPVLMVPCCNFWTTDRKLGRDELIEAIELFYEDHQISYERVYFHFEGPKNIGLLSHPPAAQP